MQVEPGLQAVSDPGAFSHATANTQEDARLDIAMNGFWGGRTERCFVDVRIFNPYAPSNAGSMTTAYRRHENISSSSCVYVLSTLISSSLAIMLLILLTTKPILDTTRLVSVKTAMLISGADIA